MPKKKNTLYASLTDEQVKYLKEAILVEKFYGNEEIPEWQPTFAPLMDFIKNYTNWPLYNRQSRTIFYVNFEECVKEICKDLELCKEDFLKALNAFVEFRKEEEKLPKYKLTEYERIVATKNFIAYQQGFVFIFIKTGTKGGCVSDENCLSQEDNSWITEKVTLTDTQVKNSYISSKYLFGMFFSKIEDCFIDIYKKEKSISSSTLHNCIVKDSVTFGAFLENSVIENSTIIESEAYDSRIKESYVKNGCYIDKSALFLADVIGNQKIKDKHIKKTKIVNTESEVRKNG